MKTELIANIGAFSELLEIANDLGINQTEWARAAWPHSKRNQQPRISELKRISEVMAAKGITQEEASKQVKRSCTVQKIFALQWGLMKMAGKKETVKAKMEKLLKQLCRTKKPYKQYDRDVTFFFLWGFADNRTKNQILDMLTDAVDLDREA